MASQEKPQEQHFCFQSPDEGLFRMSCSRIYGENMQCRQAGILLRIPMQKTDGQNRQFPKKEKDSVCAFRSSEKDRDRFCSQIIEFVVAEDRDNNMLKLKESLENPEKISCNLLIF